MFVDVLQLCNQLINGVDAEKCWGNVDSLLQQSTRCRHILDRTASAHLSPHLSVTLQLKAKNIMLSVCSQVMLSKISGWRRFVLVVIWTRVLKHIVPGTNMWDMVNIRLELPTLLPHVHALLLRHSPSSHRLRLLLAVVYLSNSF